MYLSTLMTRIYIVFMIQLDASLIIQLKMTNLYYQYNSTCVKDNELK